MTTNNEYCWPNWYSKHNVDSKSLEDQSSCLSNLFLSYLTPLLRLGSTKVLECHDIGVPSDRDRANLAFDAIVTAWAKEVERTNHKNEINKAAYDAKCAKCSSRYQKRTKKVRPFVKSVPNVARSLVNAYGPWKMFVPIILFTVSMLLQFIPVLILEDLVKYFEGLESAVPHKTMAHPWVEVAALGILPILSSIFQMKSVVFVLHVAVFVRTAISTLLYRKSLNVSAPGRACTSTGQVVNMMSNDTTQLQRLVQFGGLLFIAPLQIAICMVLIYRQVGSAIWVGVGFMVLLAPVSAIFFSLGAKLRNKVLKYSDLRVKAMSEILTGIRIIKFYAWEKPFKKEVGSLREKELHALTHLAYLSAVGFSLILFSVPVIQPILVFLTYVSVQDKALSASTAFTTVALFNIMRLPFLMLPTGMFQVVQSRISLRRIGNYLQLPELKNYVIPEPPDDVMGDVSAPGAQPGSITMTNCSFSWTGYKANLCPMIDTSGSSKDTKKDEKRGQWESSKGIQGSVSSEHNLCSALVTNSDNVENNELLSNNVETLRGITVSIHEGELVAVVGAVGSGKSSFISAILGEMEPVNGSVVHLPRTKEQRQESNFVAYCSQTPWVVNDTLKGNVLFGREYDEERYNKVIEACALLDDLAVLPAGDLTEIGERGINLSGGQKARVSLARALYARNTKVILLDDPLSAVDTHVGEHLFQNAITGPVCKGTTRILVTHHVHFLPRCDKVIVLEGGGIKHCGKYSDLISQGVDFAGAVDFDSEKAEEATDTDEKVPGRGIDGRSNREEKPALDFKKKGESLTTKEEREEGSVDSRAYLHYARAGGYVMFFSLFIMQGLGRASEIGASFWLAHWAKDAVEGTVVGDGLSDKSTTYYFSIYAIFGMIGVLCVTLRSIFMAVHRLRASYTLHNNLTASILKAPVSFFDVTPTGRILNRFAADMDKIDLNLTQSAEQGMHTTFSVLGAIGAICAATRGTFLIPLLPIGYIYYIVQKWFRRTSTELQRVTNVAGSPIFSNFSQVLAGMSTIRAYDEQKRFLSQCQSSFDNFNACFVLVYMCNFWLGLRLEILGGLIAAFIGGIAVGTAKSGFMPAGWLGLALSYAIEFTGVLKHGVRIIATIEADMNSVERVLYYTEKVEPEAPDVVPESDPVTGTWPSKGEIKMTNCSMRYRDGPLVLKDINLQIKGGEKVGVVGRTGSGKSSLVNLLFRITEIEKNGGTVVIDRVNIGCIGTEILRSNLSIIPQDPVMFSNTVRYNIDPFGVATDSEIFEVLEKVHLIDFINALPNGLEDQVAEGGENFSQGQRQLLCIARSLLRKPKILVMDEATASIDNNTDASIQQMIRENFKDATVLTIAHRLNTILDSDRILVLDDGQIVEFDTPEKLCKMPDGIFRNMVEKNSSSDR